MARGWVNRRWWASAGLLSQTRQGCDATNLRWPLSRSRRGSLMVSTLLSILPGVASTGGGDDSGELVSTTCFDATVDRADGSAEALIPLRRLCLGAFATSVDAGSCLTGMGQVDATGSSAVEASGDACCSAILAAKASSTRLASSVDKRFLAFRIAIARGCRSPSGRVSISRMSSTLIVADSSAPSLAGICGAVPLVVLGLAGTDRRRVRTS